MATTNQWAMPTMDQSQYGMLGKTFKSWGMDANWDGSGEDSRSASIAARVMNDPALMKQLGLTSADIQFKAGGYEADNLVADKFTLSDKARQALAGLTLNRTGAAGLKDGRSSVLRDAQGNILNASKPYSYDPAGDLKDAVIKGAGFMAAAYGAAQLFGLEGAAAGAAEGAAATGATGGTAGGTAAAGAAEGAAAGGAAGAAGGAGGGMLQGIPAMAGDFGAVGASASAFDTVVSLTGSEVLASAASKAAGALASGADWLSSTWSALTSGGASGTVAGQVGELFKGSSVLRDLLPIIGAGVAQQTKEKERADERAWLSTEKEKDRQFQLQREADTRRRQMPVTGSGMLGKLRVLPGVGNGV